MPNLEQFAHVLDISFADLVAGNTETFRDNLDRLSEESLILFQCNDMEPLYGDVASMEGFALMPDVGAVWPIRGGLMRYGYTINQACEGMIPIGFDTTYYPQSSRNILTGPLHGLMIELKKLRGLGGLTRFQLESPTGTSHEIGARLGIACLKAGLRNVSVVTAFCQQSLPAVPCVHEIETDPYWIH
jgi:hypothetical protein